MQGLIWQNFEPIWDCMVVLVTSKNPRRSHYKWKQDYSLIFQTLKGSLLLPKFKLTQAFMDGLVTCKNDVDPSKNESTRVATTLFPFKAYGDFFRRSRATESEVWSCRILNPFEVLWLSLIAVKLKKIQLKMKALECSQNYSLIFQALKGSLL